MNGAQHYQEAERLLAAATNAHGVPLDAVRIAAAQAHATLALAAATALADVEFYTRTDHTDWMRATVSDAAPGRVTA